MKPRIIIPSKFELTILPKIYSRNWFSLNGSNLEYYVENRDEKLEVKINDNFEECSFLLHDGKLIGASYSGENVSFLFQPTDASLHPIEIKKASVLFVYNEDDDIYFIESQEYDLRQYPDFYMSLEPDENEPLTDDYFCKPIESPEGKLIRYGCMCRLDRVANRFDSTLILEFDDAPLTFAIQGKRLFIATCSKFMFIEGYKQTIVFENLFWDGLSPNSIAYFDDENIFVGLRSGIVRLDIINRSIEFYQSGDL